MGFVKGPVSEGVIQVNRPVKFTKRIQSSMFNPWGDAWYVDGTDGDDNYDGLGPSEPKETLLAAVTAASNKDTIVLSTGDHELSATLTLDAYDTTIVGSSMTPMQPRVELEMAGETTFDPMFEVSGRGNHLANLTLEHGSRLSSGVGYATDLTCMTVSGRYNYFENVYFMTPLYPEQDVVAVRGTSGYRGIQVTGHNNYFRGCQFGSNGLNRDKANYNLEVSGIGNVFEECMFNMLTETNTTPFFVGIYNTLRDMRHTLFKNCTFYAHSPNYNFGPAYAFTTDYGANTTSVILDRCNFVNVAQISDTNNDAWIWKAMYEGENAADTTKIGMIALRNQGV